jgi:hypothetical protein
VSRANALSIETAERDLDAAVARADLWVGRAHAVIKAFFALEEIESSLRSEGYNSRDGLHWNVPKTPVEHTMSDAIRLVSGPAAKMSDLVEAIRDEFICDESWVWATVTTEADEDAGIAFNEALKDRVISVEAAVRSVGDE